MKSKNRRTIEAIVHGEARAGMEPRPYNGGVVRVKGADDRVDRPYKIISACCTL